MKTTTTLLLASLLLATAADAATRRVPKDHATIQAAINASLPGDRVIVSPGTYDEIVTINTARLRLEGKKGKPVVIDARVVPAGSGAGLRVFADDVVVENVTVRHALATAVLVTNSDLGIGVLVEADNVTLKNVTALNSGHVGFVVIGARAKIDRCEVRSASGGIGVVGDDALVRRTKVRLIKSMGIDVTGDRARIEKSTVAATGVHGITITGNQATIRKCAQRFAPGAGLMIDGDDARIEKSRSRYAQVGAMLDNATNGRVDRIRAEHSSHSGIYIQSAVGCRIERSKSTASMLAGVVMDGNGNTTRKTKAKNGGGDGIVTDGTNNRIESCSAKRNQEDGIFVTPLSSNTLLSKNVLVGNHAEGIDNRGGSSTARKNRVSKSRLDISSANAWTQFSGNKFKSGGPSTPAEMDD